MDQQSGRPGRSADAVAPTKGARAGVAQYGHPSIEFTVGVLWMRAVCAYTEQAMFLRVLVPLAAGLGSLFLGGVLLLIRHVSAFQVQAENDSHVRSLFGI